MGVSERPWHSSSEPTEPAGETAAFELSEAVPKGYIYQSSYKRQAQRLSCRHWQAGAGTLWAAHKGHETRPGHHRTAQQQEDLCKGDCIWWNHLRLNSKATEGKSSVAFLSGSIWIVRCCLNSVFFRLKPWLLLTMTACCPKPRTLPNIGNLMGCSRQNIKNHLSLLKRKGLSVLRII